MGFSCIRRNNRNEGRKGIVGGRETAYGGRGNEAVADSLPEC
jgi:hypothetical protein